MSFLDRILSESLHSDEVAAAMSVGDEAEAAAMRTGSDGGYHQRTQQAHPRAIMVTPMNSTWEYNPVAVRAEDEEFDDEVDELVENIDSITNALFG